LKNRLFADIISMHRNIKEKPAKKRLWSIPVFSTSKNPKSYTKNRFTFSDFLVTVICLTGAILAFLFFWHDLNSSLTKAKETPIGRVHYKYKIAQRRFQERLVWNMIKQDSPVYSGDMLHTAAQGEATLTFQLDESINLGENSFVQVFSTPEGTRIELSSGNVNINTANKDMTLKLLQGGIELRIKADSTISANTRVSGGTEIQISQGSVETVSKNGEAQEAETGQTLVFSKTGALQIVPTVTLIAPTPNYTFVSTGGTITVDFEWKMQNFSADDSVCFEVSSERRFSHFIEKTVFDNQTKRSLALAPGIYWWRAFPVKKDASERDLYAAANETLIEKFTVALSAKPELIAPQNGASFNYQTKKPYLRFQWRGATASETPVPVEWLLSIADNTTFVNPAFMQIVQEPTFTINKLGAGRWYWRVKPVFSGSKQNEPAADFSDIFSFSLEQTHGQKRPCELLLPASGAFVNISPSAPAVNFTWKNEPEANSFRFAIARNQEFTDTVFTQDVQENRFNFQNYARALSTGTYFWRVSWVDSDGTEAPPSAIRQFTAMEGSIIFESVSPAANGTLVATSLEKTRFTWRTNLEDAGHLQVSSDAGFSAVLAEIPADMEGRRIFGVVRTESAAGLRLPAGNYYWRITAPNAGIAGVLYTTPRPFEVRNAARISLNSPANRSELDGLEALRNPPSLVWDVDDTVLTSRLILSRNVNPEEGSKIVDITNPPKSVQTPPLTAGTYYWTIKAESQNGVDLSPFAPSSFIVRPVSLLPAVNLVSPGDGTAVTANELRANRHINFAWNASRSANAYILSIYRFANGRQNTPLFVSPPLRANRYSLTNLEILDTGAFVWQIEPVVLNNENNVEQHGIPSSRRFNINITIPEAKQYPDEQTYGLEPSN
jgi:hypothetical protein